MAVPIYYLEVNIICILILLMIMEKVRDENKTSKTYNIYLKLLISITLFLVCDLLAGVFIETMFLVSKFILLLSNSLYFLFGVLNVYYFNEYLGVRTEFIQDSKGKLFRVLPVLIVIIMLIVNLFVKNIFFIDEFNLYHQGKMLFLYYVISYSYFIDIIVNFVTTWKKEKRSQQELKKLVILALLPLIALIVQIFNHRTTLIGVGFTISVLMIFLDGVKSNSTIDELTEINNRRAFNISANKLFSDNNNVMFLMLADVNDFKKINDEYGHLMGDRALVDIAFMLKMAIKETKKNYFLARFGGDEFIIVGKYDNEDTIKELIDSIKKEEGLINNSNKSYKITMSIGYAIKNNSHLSVDDLISEADAAMYANKKEIKKKNKKVA